MHQILSLIHIFGALRLAAGEDERIRGMLEQVVEGQVVPGELPCHPDGDLSLIHI